MKKLTSIIVMALVASSNNLFAQNTPVKTETDLWSLVASDVARIDGKTMTRDELAKAFAAQFPDNQVPAQVTQSQIVSLAPQFLRQHIQRILLIDLAKADGVNIDPGTAVELLKKEWSSLPDVQSEALKTELEARKKTLDEYAKELAANQMVLDSLMIKSWIDQKLKSGIQITDQEIKKFYDDNKAQFQSAEGKVPELTEMTPQLRSYLENQKLQQLLTQKLTETEKNRKVEYLLALPSRGFGGCGSGGCQ